jgi:hypothetical protein
VKSGDASGIIQLRRLLSERFPQVRTWTESAQAKSRCCLPTGLPRLDDLLQGGWPKSAITEVVSHGSGTGSALLLRAMLRQGCHAGQWMGLIDGLDSFDPAGLEAPVLSRLFWVRCRTAEEALKAADILLRDGNLPLLALDLKMNPAAQLRKVPGTTWYRLQRIARHTSAAFVALTPHPMIASAETRLTLESRFTLAAMLENEEQLASELRFDLVRSAAAEEPIAAQAAG